MISLTLCLYKYDIEFKTSENKHIKHKKHKMVEHADLNKPALKE